MRVIQETNTTYLNSHTLATRHRGGYHLLHWLEGLKQVVELDNIDGVWRGKGGAPLCCYDMQQLY